MSAAANASRVLAAPQHPVDPVARLYSVAPALRAAPPLRPTLFHEPWWLDTVTQGQWQAAEVHERGHLVGWMPYAVHRQRGFRISVMPPFTHVLGPAIPNAGGSSKKQILRRMDIQSELAAQLPRLARFSHACHPGVQDLLGFQSRGLETFCQFTAELGPAPAEALWARLSDKTRNVVRRARESARLELLADPAEFVRLYAENLRLAGETSYVPLDRLCKVWEAVNLRGCGMIAAERDRQGELNAGALFVWDRSRLWYVLSTRHPTRSHNGSMSLLVWRGIEEACLRGLAFDFHGIASAGAARFFAGFGAQVKPRLALHHQAAPYALLKGLADALRPGRRRNTFVPP